VGEYKIEGVYIVKRTIESSSSFLLLLEAVAGCEKNREKSK
jgi:hypothetical protein